MSDTQRRTFAVNGRRISVTETGAGPVLMCVPGGPGLPGTHLEGLGGLDRNRTLIRPDWRGAGVSDPPSDHAHRLADYAEDLEAVRVFLGIDRLDVLGHSFGGLVAMTYAAAYPARVSKLVVDGPPDWRDKPRVLGIPLAAHFAVWNDAARSYAAQLRELWYWPAIEWFVRHEWPAVDPPADMIRVEAETLVLTGEHDPTFGEACAALLASYCPRAIPGVVRGAGHFTWFEQPDRYASVVTDFLS